MKYYVTVAGRGFRISVGESETPHRVLVETPIPEDAEEGVEIHRRELDAELLRVDGPESLLLVGRESHNLTTNPVDKGRWDVLLQGRPIQSCAVLDEQSRALSGGSEGAGELEISSPMPGIVLDVKVKEGDEVHKGDVLLILEAMKTENEICADLDGRVKALHVSSGETIGNDALLVELEPLEA